MSDSVPMTPNGHKMLTEELEHLRKVERPANIRDIEEARAHGDLSENAEYHAAKERQGFIEGRIQVVNYRLSRANVLDPLKMDTDRIAFSATVKLLDEDTEEELEYQIVGEDEADVKNGKISIESPLVRALIGKEEADQVRVRTPKGIRHLEVLEVKYI